MMDVRQPRSDRVARRRADRPWLRLVPVAPEPLGPVSPELVLVAPELAAAIRSTPDVIVVGSASGAPPSSPESVPRSDRAEATETERASVGGSGGGEPGASHRYDTHDMLLERHGLELELQLHGDGMERLWRLTLPRGETVEARVEGEGIPDQIWSLLRTLVNDEELRRVPRRSTNGEVQRLEDRIHAERAWLLRHEVGTRLASDPENLHQLRVASRRLRAFLRVARKLVDAAWAAEISNALREFAQASGPVRDLDVLLDELRSQAATLSDRDREAAAALIAALEQERGGLQRQLLAALDSQSFRRMLDQLALPIEEADESPEVTLEDLASREVRRLVAQVEKLGKEPDDDKLHALRIRVKRVRYATELGGLPAGARPRRVIAAATVLQDILGEHQDAVVAEEHIRAVADRLGSVEVAFAAGRLAERQRERREDLRRRLPFAWKQLRRLAHKLS